MGSHSAQAGDMSPDEFNRMSPREQETYLVEKAQEGVTSDSWLIGPIQRLMATGDARAEAERIREQSIRETTSSGDIQYVQGLQSSDANYPGTAHAQLVQFVTNGNNPSTVGETSDEYNALYQDLQTFADEFSEAVNASRSEWEGEAGDAARTFFTTMSTWSEGNAGNAKLASETIYSQSTAAATAKNSMPEEIPFSWGDELTSWATASPLTLSSRVGESFEKQRASQDAHDEAARVMTTFDNDTYAAASKQPEFPEPPKFSLSGESGSGDRNGRIDDRGTGTPTVGGPGGSGGTSAASYAPPGGGGYTTPSGSAPGSTAPSGSGGPVQLPDGTIRYPDGRVRLPNGSIRYPDGTIRRPDGTILRPGGTRAAGLSSGGFDPSGASGTSFGGAGGAALAGGMPAGGFAGGAAGGDFGPRGSGAGAGLNAAGRMSGVAQPGAMGGAQAAGAAGAPGAGAARGGAGMMGAGAGRGQGADDKDHQRKYGLDSDEWFKPERDEDGGIWRDPGTGYPVMPPVIGE